MSLNSFNTRMKMTGIESVNLKTDQWNLPNLNKRKQIDLKKMTCRQMNG